MATSSPSRISVITPSYNQAQYIEETLRSVESQTYAHIEHVVVDGGSTDGTVDILKGFPRVRWVSEPDRGQTHAINKGLAMTSGQIVCWLNSDDTYPDSRVVEEVAAAFDKDVTLDVLYGDYVITDAQGHPLQVKQEIPFDRNIMLFGVNIIGQPASFFRRSLVDRIGRLDESYHYLMDLEFWARASRMGAKFRHVRRVLATYRWHEASKTLELSGRLRTEWRRILEREVGWRLPGLAHEAALRAFNLYFRAKRQVWKLFTGASLDWWPTHWRMRRFKTATRRESPP
jgi:glycosyltransferase involved in cell wall biosynthesis